MSARKLCQLMSGEPVTIPMSEELEARVILLSPEELEQEALLALGVPSDGNIPAKHIHVSVRPEYSAKGPPVLIINPVSITEIEQCPPV